MEQLEQLASVMINGLEWTVYESGNNQYVSLEREPGEHNIGYYDSAQLAIFIHKDLPIDQKRRTLIHELAHAFIYSYCVGDGDLFNEEVMCEFVAAYSAKILNIAKSIY